MRQLGKPKLTPDDIALLQRCKREHDRLRIEARRLKELAIQLGRDADQLSTVHLARKFNVHPNTLRSYISD